MPRLAAQPARTAPEPWEAAGVAPDADPVVRLRQVVIEYRGRRGSGPVRAADDVSLHMGAGELLGLVGESGSGKSTIGRALAGLAPVTADESS